MKIKSLIVALAALLLGNFTTYAQDLNEVKKMFNEAATTLKAKNYTEALTMLEKTVEAAFNADAMDIAEKAQKYIPECYYRLGGQSVNAGNLNEALDYFKKANETALLYNAGATARKAKNAISGTYKSLGADSYNNGDYATAVSFFSQGYEANPQDTDLALYLANSYCQLKDFENGVQVYTNIIALGQSNSRFAEHAGKAKEELTNHLLVKAQEENLAGNKEAAYATLETLINADPMNTGNQMYRLQLAGSHEDWDNIIAWGEMAAAFMTTPEQQSEVYYLMAVANDSKNNNQVAVDTYKLVVAGDKVEAAQKRIAELEAFIKAEKEANK